MSANTTWVKALEHLQRLLGRARHLGLVAGLEEESLDGPGEGALVVDDEDRGRVHATLGVDSETVGKAATASPPAAAAECGRRCRLPGCC